MQTNKANLQASSTATKKFYLTYNIHARIIINNR